MSNGKLSKQGPVALLAIVSVTLSACNPGLDSHGDKRVAGRSQAAPTTLRQTLLPQSLRTHVDAASGKVWALHADRLEVHDPMQAGATKSIRLPGWTWAAEPYACPPDIALLVGGDVVVTSNVMPAIWRIDPATLAVTRHDVAVPDDRNRDVGFSRLFRSARSDTLFAAGALDNSLWLIDPSLERAQPIGLSPALPQGCVLSIRPGSTARALCIQIEQAEWIVTLSADLRSGEAHPAGIDARSLRACRVPPPGLSAG